MISVIVPVYKAEKTIVRCIESVISQKYADWELILVDDGSPDNCGEICEEYGLKDKRIRVIHQPNSGVSQARNRGIEGAIGDFICFIDSDDYVSPYYLSDFALDSLCDFEIQGLTSTYPNSEIKQQLPEIFGRFAICEMFSIPSLWYLIKGPYCKLFRRKILIEKNVRFPDGLSYGEDEIFVLEYLLRCSQDAYIHAVSNYFYTHENEASLTHRFISGIELQAAVSKQYSLYCDLNTIKGPLPTPFVSFYRKNRAIDFYQSLHNMWNDPLVSIKNKIQNIIVFDRQVWSFVKREKNLPKRFFLMRMALLFISYLPIDKNSD